MAIVEIELKIANNRFSVVSITLISLVSLDRHDTSNLI